MFSGVIERDEWHEMAQNLILILLQLPSLHHRRQQSDLLFYTCRNFVFLEDFARHLLLKSLNKNIKASFVIVNIYKDWYTFTNELFYSIS